MDALFADTGSCVRAAAGVFERAPVRGLSESNQGPGSAEWDEGGVGGRRVVG